MQLTNDTGDYCVAYDTDTGTISCEGLLIFRGDGYRLMTDFFDKVVDDGPTTITLDIRNLEYLNCSGMATIVDLIMNTRQKGASKLMIQCSKEYIWQERSIKAISRFMPGMELVFE